MLTRIAPLFLTVLAGAAACSTAGGSSPTATPDLGPTSTPVSESQLDHAYAGFDEATEVFNEEMAVSSAVIDAAAGDGWKDVELDRLIRREAMRLVRVADAVKLKYDSLSPQLASRVSPYPWVRDRMRDAHGWMRDQQLAHFEPLPEYPLASPDTALSAMLALIVDVIDDDSPGDIRFIDLFMSAARSGDPFRTSAPLTGISDELAHLTTTQSARPILNWVDKEPSWILNPDTMPQLLAAMEMDGQGADGDTLRTYIQSGIERDAAAKWGLNDEAWIYDRVAVELMANTELSEADHAMVVRTGASRLVWNHALALNEQAKYLRTHGVDAPQLYNLNVAIEESGIFGDDEERLAQVVAEIADMSRRLVVPAEAQGMESIVAGVAREIYEAAKESDNPTDSEAMLIETVELDMDVGAITQDASGGLVFGEDSFLLHPYYYDYEFAFFPVIKRILRANLETLASQAPPTPTAPAIPY